MISHHHPAARAVHALRLLRAIGPVSRRRRVPRQQQPDSIRVAYYRALQPFLAPARAAFAVVRDEVLRLLADERRAQGKQDASRGEAAQQLVERAGEHAAQKFRPRELEAVAERFGRRTSEFQRGQFDRQVRAAMGVPLASIEKPTRDLIPLFSKQNVELVETIPERYFDRLAKDVRDAFESGMHPDTLAQKFVDVDGMVESDARRIARDQIGKLNGQLNQERQQSLGVTGYVWRGAMDNRERDEHREREGQRFDWDDPPEDGAPGEPVMCRCYGEPDFSEILTGAADED